MARRRDRRPTWGTEALLSLTERLRPFEGALGGRSLLEVRCGPTVGFGFLLDWLRPTRLVAVDVDGPPDARARPLRCEPRAHYGAGGSFDAAFLMAHGQLKRAVRRVSLPEIARVLSPSGLLIVTTLGTKPGAIPRREALPELDRSAEAWSLLHASLAGSGFRISEEYLGMSRLLVAQKVAADQRP